MKREEFVKKFKVGDKLKTRDWELLNYPFYVEILNIGKKSIHTSNQDGDESIIAFYTINENWFLYEEPKCKYCGGAIAIRNPTGICDHLYYPENVNKSLIEKIEPQKTMLVSPSVLTTQFDPLNPKTKNSVITFVLYSKNPNESNAQWPARVVLKNIKELPKVPGEYVWGELPNFSADLYFEVPVENK